MFRRNAGAGICNRHSYMSICFSRNVEGAAAGHGVLGIEKEIEEDLLQLACIAENRRQCRRKFDDCSYLRGLELVLEQRERLADDRVHIRVAELRTAGA